MSFKVVIPARYASERLRAKPLLDIAGRPMLQWVYDNACSSGASEVIIATDDDRIAAAARAFGADVHMTSRNHRSGTDRIAQVVQERSDGPRQIVVNLQGDEPLLPAKLISQVAGLLRRESKSEVATLCEPIATARELFDPAVVKVVLDARGRALYFSRAPIPWHRQGFSTEPRSMPSSPRYFRHIGIYAYRVAYLAEFVTRPVSPLEAAESLEQLRALHYGAIIAVAEASVPSGPGVDTEDDVERVRRAMSRARES